MKVSTLLSVFQLLSVVFAVTPYKKTPVGTLIGFGCGNSLEATLCIPKKSGFTYCPCIDINALGSWMYCGYQHAANDKEKRQVQRYLKNACPNMTVEAMNNAYENVTSYLVNTSTVPNFNKSRYVNYPVYYNESLYMRAYQSQKHYTDNLTTSVAWGSGLIAFWALLLILGGVDHWGSRFFPSFSLKLKKTIGQLRPCRWWRKNVTLPALLNEKHTTGTVFGYLPTRFESLVIFIFFVLAVLAETLNINTYRNSIIFKLHKVQLTRFIGDRSGIVSAFLMVPTYLFAGRNNFFLWVTGWKQSTFLTFHKWLARTLVLTASLHSIVFVANSSYLGLYKIRLLIDWWRLGALAIVAGGVMFLQSLGFLRAYSYEIFLYFHIALAIIFLAGAWVHVVYYDYGNWIYTCAAIWCFDRFARIVRMAKFGIKSAEVTLVSEEMLVLTMPHGFRIQKPMPGSFGYIHFLNSWTWFQSHPFTLLEDTNGKQKFLIKIKKGITKRLHDRILNEPNQSCRVKVAVEGFYGEYKQAYAYEQVVMVTGGNGIPGVYEYVADIIKNNKAGKGKTKHIKFYWVIRHWHSIDWFLQELKELQRYDCVETIVYVTGYHEMKLGAKFSPSSSALTSTKSSTESDADMASAEKQQHQGSKETTCDADTCVGLDNIFRELPHIEFRDSRPNMPQLLRQDISQAGSTDNIAVLSCAHNALCDDVRKAVAYEAGEPRAGRIDLFELLQLW